MSTESIRKTISGVAYFVADFAAEVLTDKATIVSHTIETGGLTNAGSTHDETSVEVQLSGGVLGGVYTAVVNAQSSSGKRYRKSYTVRIVSSLGVYDVSSNDQTQPSTFTIGNSSSLESAGYVQWAMVLSPSAPASIAFATAITAGTAGATDYSPPVEVSLNNGTTWGDGSSFTAAAGTATVLLRLAITNDTIYEADEAFTLTVSRISGSTTNLTASATGTIINEDALPAITIANAAANEGGTAIFQVSMSRPSSTAASVQYATASGTATSGTDFTDTTGTLTFTPGETLKTISVPISTDVTSEGDETFTVALSSASGATIVTASATGTITGTPLGDAPGLVQNLTVNVADNGFFDVKFQAPASLGTNFAGYRVDLGAGLALVEITEAQRAASGGAFIGGIPSGVVIGSSYTARVQAYGALNGAWANAASKVATRSTGAIAINGNSTDLGATPIADGATTYTASGLTFSDGATPTYSWSVQSAVGSNTLTQFSTATSVTLPAAYAGRRITLIGRHPVHGFGKAITTLECVSNGKPVSQSPGPSWSGTASEGQQITVSAGPWTFNPTQYDFQRMNKNVSTGVYSPVGVKQTVMVAQVVYTILNGDLGSTIRWDISARNAAGDAEDYVWTSDLVIPGTPSGGGSGSTNPGTRKTGAELTNYTGPFPIVVQSGTTYSARRYTNNSGNATFYIGPGVTGYVIEDVECINGGGNATIESYSSQPGIIRYVTMSGSHKVGARFRFGGAGFVWTKVYQTGTYNDGASASGLASALQVQYCDGGEFSDSWVIGADGFTADVYSVFSSNNVKLMGCVFDVTIQWENAACFTIGDYDPGDTNAQVRGPGGNNYVAGCWVKRQTGGVPAGVFGSTGGTVMERNCFTAGMQVREYNGAPFTGVTIRNSAINMGASFLPAVSLVSEWGTNVNSTQVSAVPGGLGYTRGGQNVATLLPP